MFQLRDYQQKDLDLLRSAIRRGARRPIFVAPCAYGKTALCFEVIRSAVHKGKTVLFLAHRRLLIEQTYRRFKEYGIEPSILMSGYEYEPSQVVLATVQTYNRRILLDDLQFNRFFVDADLIVVDEAHFSVSPSYKKIFELYPNSHLLGLTATPARSDQRGLGEVYDKIVQGTSVKDLLNQNFLTPVRYFAGKAPNMKGVKIDPRTGEYDTKQTNSKTIPLVGDVVENWLRLGENRPTICFATSIKHSIFFRDSFRKHGIPAEHMDANTPHEERQIIIKKLKNGDIKVITNCQLLTEGVDIPIVSCAILARPIRSLALHHQMIGRVMRIEDGKPDQSIILDHGGNIERNGFIEDPVIWTLDGKEKAWRKPKKKEREPKKVKCVACGLIFEKANKCPDCGSEVQTFGKKLEIVKQDLKEISKTKIKNNDLPLGIKRNTYSGLLYIAQKKGYKRGWCDHMYKKIFGEWPQRINKRTVLPCKAEGKAKNLITYGFIKNSFGRKKTHAI